MHYEVETKRKLGIIFKTCLFVACFVFVAIRGYFCNQKYVAEPEAVDISFQFIGRLPFPSISICTWNKYWIMFNNEVFDYCNLSASNYQKDGKWVGTGNKNCTDPKELALKLQRFEQMRLKNIIIKTYKNNKYFLSGDEMKTLNWYYSPMTEKKRCHTLDLPKHMVVEGKIIL